MKNYDIVIIGAGPAGSSAALTLKNSGLTVALCESTAFPREKICGDGLCDRSINTLKAISEAYFKELLTELAPLKIKKASLVYNRKHHSLSFKSFGYTIPRLNFDNFLITKVKQNCPNVDLIENCRIRQINHTKNGIELLAKNNAFKTNFVVFANGANSSLTQNFTGNKNKKDENGLAVRAYFSGLENLKEDQIELHYVKAHVPGYFWIFPLGNGQANIGFGYHLKHISKNNNSIKNIFNQWVDTELKERFPTAKQLTLTKGGVIPFSENEYNCYGDNYVSAGDAASLVDPLSGGGIGNAMFSGREAALQAIQCFKKDDFSQKETQNYAQALKKRMQNETANRLLLRNAVTRHKWILNALALFDRSAKLKQQIIKWYLH